MSNEAEATLPKEVIHEIRSSPPISTACSLFEMDDKFVSTSDVSVPQDAQQTPKHPRHKRMESDDTERPASAQQNHDNSEEHSNVDEGQEPSDDEDLDPAAQIADFDWDDLHQRYHEKINACHEEEFKLMQEWESLMEYFRVWADSGHARETDRTFQRLQTRTRFVQNEEDALENKRNHYINVVRAFESALNLLKASGIRG